MAGRLGGILQRYWEVLFVAALALVMLLIRLRSAGSFLGSGDSFAFLGADPYYHYRETLGTVRSFPHVPRWDPWTAYPNGTWTGQFGTLFDWVAAAVVVLLHGKGATDAQVARVLIVYPAVLGALILVPFYLLARRFFGAPGAIAASLTLALLPGEFLYRSLAGYSDHHVAEVLCLLLVVVAFFAATERATAWKGRWPVLAWSIGAAAAMALEVDVWSPGLIFLGMIAAYAAIVIAVDAQRGKDTTGFALSGAIAFLGAAILLLPLVETHAFLGYFAQLDSSNVAPYDLFHVAALAAAGVGILAVHGACRLLRRRGLPTWLLPLGAAVALGAVVLALVAFRSPLAADIPRALSWVTGASVDPTILTIAEATPGSFFCNADTNKAFCLQTRIGPLAPLSLAILLFVVIRAIRKGERPDVFLSLLGVVAFFATLSQIRFSYYYTVVIALLVGWVVARILDALTSTTTRQGVGVKAGAVATAFIVLIPGTMAMGGHGPLEVWTHAVSRPDDNTLRWTPALAWMRNGTPDAGVDLSTALSGPPSGPYPYPPQAYGVLSWWNVGHFLETMARRPPVTNPFQQGAPMASLYFTDPDPDSADRLLDNLTAHAPPVRYVAVDDDMTSTYMPGISIWARELNASRPDLQRNDYLTFHGDHNQTDVLPVANAATRDTMMGKLADDGNGLSHMRLVWEDPKRVIVGSESSRTGTCVDRPLTECGATVPLAAAKSYQPGSMLRSSTGLSIYDLRITSPVKVYERVAGARLAGVAAPGALVSASVDVVVPIEGGNRTFRHVENATAGPDGRYEVTFPYSTRDPVPPSQGGTAFVVAAGGPVTVSWGNQARTVDVPDAAVLHGERVEVPS